MKEIQDEIIRKFKEKFPDLPIYAIAGLNNILTEEFLKVNPERIDEERFLKIYGRLGRVQLSIQEYNSTLSEKKELIPLPEEMPEDIENKWNHKDDYDTEQLWEDIRTRFGTPKSELQPLPSEIPKEFEQMYYPLDARDLWKWLHKHYGTPETKTELVSVDVLFDEANKIYNYRISDYGITQTIKSIVEHFHDIFSLHYPIEEWWNSCE